MRTATVQRGLPARRLSRLALLLVLGLWVAGCSSAPESPAHPAPADDRPVATTSTEPNEPSGADGAPEPTMSPSSSAIAVPGLLADTVLSRCVKGIVAFRPPNPMRQGDTTEFTVRVALAGSPTDPVEGLEGEGPAQRRTTTTCERMRAELTGVGMDVQGTGSENGEILIPSDGVGEWMWLVTARESGTKSLTLRLFVPGQDNTDITLESFHERIRVKVGVRYAAAGFVKEYFPALGITVPVLVGAGAWMWSKRRKGKPATGAHRSAER